MDYRTARAAELDAIYLMGYSAWGDGLSQRDYLDGCRNSPKYRLGTWMVLADAADVPVSSFLRWTFAIDSALPTFGIGSLATHPAHRRAGHASELIGCALTDFAAHDAGIVFLYADIDTAFYARFGFSVVADGLQAHGDARLMALFRPDVPPGILAERPQLVPRYF